MENYFSMSSFVDVADSNYPIQFDWAGYLKDMRGHIKELAANRCYTTLRDRNGRVNA